MGKRYRIDELFDLQMGKTPPRKELKYWTDGRIDWVSIGDLSRFDKYVGTTKEQINDAAIHECHMKQVPANTLIMSFKLSIGKTAITTSPAYTNEAIMAFLDKHVVPLDLDYLYHLFSSRDWLSDTNIAVMGATLNKKTLGAQKIVVPALTEQKEIAEHLAAVQSQISVAEQMLDKADELIQSRFVEMFERDKQIKHVRLDHISLVGSSHRVFKSEILTSGVPFYRGSEISSLSRGDSASASLFISYEHYEELISQSGKPEIGDLLLPSICDKGQIWRVNTNDPFYFKDGRVLWIRPDKTIINSEYLKRAIDKARFFAHFGFGLR